MLRQARRDIEAQHAAQPNLTRGCFAPPFVMIRPTDLAGFVADPPQVTPLYQLGASVTIRLVDTSNPDRWVDFWQGLGCFGVLPGPTQAPMEVTQMREIEVPGIDTAKSITDLQLDASGREQRRPADLEQRRLGVTQCRLQPDRPQRRRSDAGPYRRIHRAGRMNRLVVVRSQTRDGCR